MLEELSLLLLELWLLEVDGNREELSFKTTLGDCEVDDIHKRCNIWVDLHKLVTSCQVEAEIRVEVDRLLTDLHDLSWTLLHEVLAKDWHEH